MNYQKYLRVFHRLNFIDFLARLFGLIPLFDSKTFWSKTLSKSYATIYSSALVYVFYYQVKLRIDFGFARRSKKANFVTAFSTTILFATNILISLTVIIFKDKKYSYMVERIGEMQRIISPYFGDNNNKKLIMIATLFLHLWYGIVSYDDATIAASGWLSIQFYVYDSYLRYRLLVFTMYLYFLLKDVLDSIRRFNKLLRGYGTNGDRFVSGYFDDDLTKLSKDICEAFVEFNEIVLSFNDIFGWILLLLLLQYFYIYLVLSNSITNLIAGYKVHWTYPANVAMLLIYATVGIIY